MVEVCGKPIECRDVCRFVAWPVSLTPMSSAPPATGRGHRFPGGGGRPAFPVRPAADGSRPGSLRAVEKEIQQPSRTRRCIISREPLKAWIIMVGSGALFFCCSRRSTSLPQQPRQWIASGRRNSAASCSWFWKTSSCLCMSTGHFRSSPASPIPHRRRVKEVLEPIFPAGSDCVGEPGVDAEKGHDRRGAGGEQKDFLPVFLPGGVAVHPAHPGLAGPQEHGLTASDKAVVLQMEMAVEVVELVHLIHSRKRAGRRWPDRSGSRAGADRIRAGHR